MRMNQAIAKKRKFNMEAFFMLIVVQFISLLILNLCFTVFGERINTFGISKAVIFVSMIVVCAGEDMFFVYNRIILLGKLLYEKPVRCRIEDIIYVGHKEDGHTKFNPYPIVRSLEDNRLFFAYGNYSLSPFRTSTFGVYKRMVECTIYKKDGTPVNVGDIVDMYILQSLDIPVRINVEKDIVKLKNRKFRFYHKNDEFQITMFTKVNIFRGVIDLEV